MGFQLLSFFSVNLPWYNPRLEVISVREQSDLGHGLGRIVTKMVGQNLTTTVTAHTMVYLKQ